VQEEEKEEAQRCGREKEEEVQEKEKEVTRSHVTSRAVLLAALALLVAPGAVSATVIPVTKTGVLSDNTNDDQLCSLREAVNAANTNMVINPAGGNDCAAGEATALDTISVPGGGFLVEGANSDEDANASGDYDLGTAGGPVRIDGAAPGTTVINAADHDRGIDVLGAGSATLSDLTVTNGTVTGDTGGGVKAATNLTLSNVAVSGNIVNGTTVSTMKGGGVAQTGGTLNVSNSTISGNTIDASAAGAGQIGGGGVALNGPGGSIDRTLLANNTITGATNQTAGGGGLGQEAATADLSITNSLIRSNTISGPDTAGGGGVFWDDDIAQPIALSVENTTFDGNSTGSGTFAVGGGLHVDAGSTANVANATLTSNSGGSFGGDGLFNDGTLSVRGSALSNSDDCGGTQTITSLGYNVESPSNNCSFGATGDLVAAITVKALGDYGGPTESREPDTGSPLIDHIPEAACLGTDGAPLTGDQRGLPRPDDGDGDGAYECESGSVELQVSGPRPVPTLPAIAVAAAQPAPTAKKKCKKKKKKRSALAAKKKCKKKKR
jgi:CSLREA domain-containing protein